MGSLRSQITVATVCVIALAMSIVAFFGVTALRDTGRRDADQLLLLMCETGQKNLDNYFQSVEQSVAMVSAFVEADMDGLDDAKLQAHMTRASDIFRKVIRKTDGVLTYYYRIDPTVSKNVKGFWYVINDEGILDHEVTDISLYDTWDTSKLVWFTIPKVTGKSAWLPPYFTENLGARVISYNIPIYYEGNFVGVVGIELDYLSMAKMIDNITIYDNGYAFLNDDEGNIIYHPRMDVLTMAEPPKVPEGLLSKSKFISYSFEGVEKHAVWLTLSNGMRLNLTVPVEEINAEWQGWSKRIIIIFALLLGLFTVVVKVLVGRIVRDKA